MDLCELGDGVVDVFKGSLKSGENLVEFRVVLLVSKDSYVEEMSVFL